MSTRVWSRRDGLIGLASLGLAGWSVPTGAGQLEEPLADSVRSALSAAIANKAPPVPEFDSTDKRLRYLRWLGGVVRGDLGQSVTTQMPVAELVGSRLPNSLLLAAVTALFSVPIALVFGIASAVWRGSWLDRIASVTPLGSA